MIKERRTYRYVEGPKVYTLECDECHKIARASAECIGDFKDTFMNQYGWSFYGNNCFCSECSKEE